MKQFAILLSLLLLTIITGCTDKAESNEQAAKQVKDAAVQPEEKGKENEIPIASRTLEGMLEQSAGVLVKEHIDPKLEIVSGWNGMDYNNFYDKTFKPIAEKDIRTYLEKKQDLSADELYDYLVYMLGSGRYKEFYDQLLAYEHGFVMPELPDGADQVETKQKKMNVIVLMDASGSMKGQVSGGVKMDLAKETIASFMEQIPGEANISLMAYGHTGTGKDSDKAASCSAIESVYPLKPYQSPAFNESMNSFDASGWTPLAGAINKAHQLLQSYNTDEYHNVVYIVSDGIETCDGDPVQEAKKLQDANIKAKVNIIGFDVDDKGQNQLKQVAQAGGGDYATVRDKSELETLILKKWRPTIGQLVFTQGVGMKDTTNAMERMNQIKNPLYFASDREKNRIKNAAYYLNNEELINDETEAQILKLADTMHKLRQDHFNEITKQKEDEMWNAHEEINNKVKAWRAKWEEELGDDAYKP